MNAPSLIEAVLASLSTITAPLLTRYDIAKVVVGLYVTKEWSGARLRLKKDYPANADIERVIEQLLGLGFIHVSADIPYKGVYERTGMDVSAEQVVCHLDPFCYLSHLSAMQWHGITNRRVHTLFVSAPSNKQWASLLKEYYYNDLEQLDKGLSERFPRSYKVFRHEFGNKVKGKTVKRHASKSWDADAATVMDSVRVASVGRTFLDMVRDPELCGGIHHVLDVFEDSGRRFKNAILREVEAHGSKLDKSRVGYIMEERLGLENNPTLSKWLDTAVQRGGSRKLDARGDYAPEFSERWCLSLNV